MERALRVVAKGKFPHQAVESADVARAAWPIAAGKKIAAHTSRVTLVRTTLVIEVEDAIWQKQLHALRIPLLRNLAKVLGNGGIITDLEFRIAIKRREVQRAATRDGDGAAIPSADEADAIDDPILRHIYRRSRKNATA